MIDRRKKIEKQACQIMTKPVESVRMTDSLVDVAHLFTENGIGAAVVLDENKKPVGVITKTDLVRHENATDGTKTISKKSLGRGFHDVDEGDTVLSWMTPVIFSVAPETKVSEVAKRMIKYGIHHIFVRSEKEKEILGVVSTFDILKQVANV